MFKAYFRQFANYNAWANAKLYDAAAALPDEAYRRDGGAFFGSVEGTLNHILVADRIWCWRLDGRGTPPDRLDRILYHDLAELRAARDAEDRRIRDYIDGLEDAAFLGSLTYSNMSGTSFSQPLNQVLAHVFNHQTHHRGQAHGLISRFGGTAPELDFIYYIRSR